MTNDQLVVVLRVDGKLRVLEHVGGKEDIEWMAQRHRTLAAAAQRAGQTWVLEIFAPDGEIPAVRLSNDPEQLRCPIGILELVEP
jgi:hypothetical protein